MQYLPFWSKKLKLNSMELYQILLYAISILIAIYLIAFFYALESLITFRNKIKKRTLAISILLSEKKDVLLSMYALIDNASLLKDDATKDVTTQVRWLQTANLKIENIENSIATLSSLQKKLIMFSSSEEMRGNKDFEAYREIINDLDANYRRTAAIFNSDTVGYEYWRKTPLFRLCFFVFGFKKIKRLP